VKQSAIPQCPKETVKAVTVIAGNRQGQYTKKCYLCRVEKFQKKVKKQKRKLILVSNDDGVQALGLASLIDCVRSFGDVFVVAPEKGESGKSHAITISVPVRVTKHHEEKGLVIYSCTGTPVDAVKLAINQLLPRRPDYILSGINHGSNSSISVLYSGTMGAAIEGCLNGIPSIGFSVLDHQPNADFTLAKKIVTKVFSAVLKNGFPENICLNVNIPKIKEKDLKGIRICRQSKGVWKEEYERRVDPHHGEYFWLTGDFDNFEPEARETDEWVLKRNYVSIVPIQTDLTAYQAIDKLKSWKL
jgi:5'-nucleotidase